MSRNSRIALLRGINVGGHNKVPMAELREVCEALGWEDLQTYIQSGNVVFKSDGGAAALERDLEKAIEDRLGLDIPVIVRTSAEWTRYLESNPFPGASEEDARFVHLVLSKQPPAPGCAEALEKRGEAGERAAIAGGALWIHYAGGAGRSKLTPALLDSLVGSPITGRNWRTVLKIAEMLES